MWKSVLALVALGTAAVPASACESVVMYGEPPVQMRDEAAIIVWDAARHEEHFIRQAEFDSSGENFGFIVPTPTEPELHGVRESVFDGLYELTKPRTVTKNRWKWDFGSVLLSDRRGRGYTLDEQVHYKMADDSPDDVSVLQRVRVADYDAAVLKSTDGPALRRWLQSHGYAANASFDNWLKPYAQRGWVITAFKVTRGDFGGPARLAPIRMSFKTETPFYPYRESKQETSGDGRSLRVFFFARDRADGAMQGQPFGSWPRKVLWSDNVPETTLDTTAGSLSLQTADLRATPRLTVFLDSSSPRPGYADVNFATAADQSVVQPPPNIKWRERTIFIPAEGVVVLVLGTIWFRRRQRENG